MSNLVFIIWGLFGTLVLMGAGLGWWYGTATFYLRDIGEEYMPRAIGRGRRVRRHVRRIGLTIIGAAGGAVAAFALVTLLGQLAARHG
ncbi:MAG: hypothetical protein EXR12_00605 [Rhodospirillaceae bacterium]|nr:hypothetical protein [Rhodospirillaceae bacterium]